MHTHTHTHTHTHSSAALASESPEAAMERHRRNQESIAQEMMGIARSLKENAKTAQNIITGDNKVTIIEGSTVCTIEKCMHMEVIVLYQPL